MFELYIKTEIISIEFLQFLNTDLPYIFFAHFTALNFNVFSFHISGSVLLGLVGCFTMRIVSYAVLGVLLIYSISVGRSKLLATQRLQRSRIAAVAVGQHCVEFMICHKYVATAICDRMQAGVSGDSETDWHCKSV